MRPTIDDQLDGARRLLAGVERDEGLSASSRELLAHVHRLLTRVGGSWATTLPFLVEDNAATAALLTDVGVPVPPGEPAGLDVAAAAARNAELRGALSAAIRDLPHDAQGAAARARIGEHLRRRVAADPT